MAAPIRVGRTKNFIYIKTYKICISCFMNFFLRPTLIGAALLIVPTFTKGAPRRRGHRKKIIKKELNFIYDFGK